MNHLTENIESDIIDKNVAPVVHQRNRLTLLNKKEVVHSFYQFLNGAIDTKLRFIAKDLAIKAFLKYHHQLQPLKHADVNAEVDSIKKWIDAERRGEYLDWNGNNNLSNKVCRWDQVVTKQINSILSCRDLHCAEFNQVVKSPSTYLKASSSKELGVVACKRTPAGTFLGFYTGECVTPKQVLRGHTFNFDNLFSIGNGQFMFANDFLSCFGRYYKRSEDDHNVCVKRLLWTDPQKALCFITTRDVDKGEEFFIPYGCENWEEHDDDLIASTSFRRVSTQLMAKVPRNYHPQDEELYTPRSTNFVC